MLAGRQEGDARTSSAAGPNEVSWVMVKESFGSLEAGLDSAGG